MNQIKGIEIAREFYKEYGKPMLEERFPEYLERIACGIVGEGSDSLGFDDSISRDHDFGAGFCMWLTDEDFDAIGKELHSSYMTLPKSFMGFPARDPVSYGEQRLSSMRISSFYKKFTNHPEGPISLMDWLFIPEDFLATATSGEVFEDPLGRFTVIRERLLAFYPEDVRLSLIARRAFTMGQAGQYNYPRCVKRGEKVAALLAFAEFTKAACSMVYLLNRRYAPYYKWMHRGIQGLPILSETYDLLSSASDLEPLSDQRTDIIEQICLAVLAEMKRQNITKADDEFLLNHTEEISSKIKDDTVRNFRAIG